jgi:hypothetical protein
MQEVPDPIIATIEPVVYKIRNEGKVVAQVNRVELVPIAEKLASGVQWLSLDNVPCPKITYWNMQTCHPIEYAAGYYAPKSHENKATRKFKAQKVRTLPNMQKKAKTPVSSQNTISYADALRAQYRKAGSVRIGVAS